MKISVVSPVYMGEHFIQELVVRLGKTLKKISGDYEVILVNDNSPDNSWDLIESECEKNSNIKGINLSRNFGQHYAISAGLEHTNGDWVVVMDCDLQDVPEEIEKLYDKSKEGYDVVLAKRKERKDGLVKKLLSNSFYKVLAYLSGVDYDHQVANYGLYHRKVITAILSMGDSIRFFPSMVLWVGFKKTSITVDHGKRSIGKSSYSIRKLLNLAMDIILSYSDKPIRLVIKGGIIISFLAFIFALFTFIRAWQGQIEVPGYASIIISIWFFSGLIISIVGVVGLYVSKTFQSVKRRPVYIASEKINF